MKKKIYFLVATVVVCSVMLFGVGCSNESEPNVPEGIANGEINNGTDVNKGYIVDYHQCSGLKIGETTAKAGGYFIISENLKDTLLTFNLPDNLFEFPLAFFGKGEYSEHSYRYDYKIQYTYRIVEENEKTLVVCAAMLKMQYPMAKEVILTSVNKE